MNVNHPSMTIFVCQKHLREGVISMGKHLLFSALHKQMSFYQNNLLILVENFIWSLKKYIKLHKVFLVVL